MYQNLHFFKQIPNLEINSLVAIQTSSINLGVLISNEQNYHLLPPVIMIVSFGHDYTFSRCRQSPGMTPTFARIVIKIHFCDSSGCGDSLDVRGEEEQGDK